jgi:hypothetical protein
MYECDISQYITETKRKFCIEDATKMYTNIFNQQHSTCHGLQTDVAVKSGVIAQPIKYSEQGTKHLLCRCGIHSQHCTFSPYINSPDYKNIFLLFVLSSNVTKISSQFLLQILLQKQQHIFVLPTTLHSNKHAVYTCKVNSYGAMQLGSSLYIVHECVHTPHLK